MWCEIRYYPALSSVCSDAAEQHVVGFDRGGGSMYVLLQNCRDAVHNAGSCELGIFCMYANHLLGWQHDAVT